MGEPYFGGSIFSWYTYWYARTSLEKYMASKVAVIPAYAIIRAIAGNCCFNVEYYIIVLKNVTSCNFDCSRTRPQLVVACINS